MGPAEPCGMIGVLGLLHHTDGEVARTMMT
jgi:hypothetical protein